MMWKRNSDRMFSAGGGHSRHVSETRVFSTDALHYSDTCSAHRERLLIPCDGWREWMKQFKTHGDKGEGKVFREKIVIS